MDADDLDRVVRLHIDLDNVAGVATNGSVLAFVPGLLASKETELANMKSKLEMIVENVPIQSEQYASRMSARAMALEATTLNIETLIKSAKLEAEKLRPTVERMAVPLKELSHLSSINTYVDIFQRAKQLSGELIVSVSSKDASAACSKFLSLVSLLPSAEPRSGGSTGSVPSLELYKRLLSFCESQLAPVKKLLISATRGLSKRLNLGKGSMDIDDETSETVLPELKLSFSRLLALQIGWERVDTGECSEIVWAVNAFALPLLSRFVFHFGADKDTDRLDRPEWPFQWLKANIASYLPFVMKELQPLIKSTVLQMMGVEGVIHELEDTESRELQSIADYARNKVPRRYHAMHIGHQFLHLLVCAQAKRLNERFAAFAKDNVLFSRTLEQTIVFDCFLRDQYRYSTTYGGVGLPCLVWKVFTTNEERFQLLLDIDVQSVESRFSALTKSPNAWSIPMTQTMSTELADGVARILASLEKRLSALQNDSHRKVYILRVHFALLRRFLSVAASVQHAQNKIRAINSLVFIEDVIGRLQFQSFGMSAGGSGHGAAGVVADVKHYMPTVVKSFWSAAATSANSIGTAASGLVGTTASHFTSAMSTAASGLVGTTASKLGSAAADLLLTERDPEKAKGKQSESFFLPILEESKAARRRIMNDVVEQILKTFEEKSAAYFEGWRDRSNPYDGSNRKVNFAPALNRLREDLAALTKNLSKPSMRDLVRMTALRIDHILFENVVVGAVFISKAVKELQDDLQNVFAIFKSVHSDYHFEGGFRLTIETVTLLRLQRAERNKFMVALKQLSLGHPNLYPCRWETPHVEDSAEDASRSAKARRDPAHVEMHSILATKDVWSLHPEHALALLKMRV